MVTFKEMKGLQTRNVLYEYTFLFCFEVKKSYGEVLGAKVLCTLG